MVSTRFCVALCGILLLAGSTEADQVNPIDKVFALMDELTAKVTAEGEAADKAYKEFFGWCDETSTNAKNSLKTLNADKAKLEAVIAKGTADATAAAAKIEDLASSIAQAEADLKSATEIRTKEAAEFAAEENELVVMVDDLDTAIAKLSGEAQKSPALVQQWKQAVASNNVKALMSTLDAVISKAGITSMDKNKLLALVQSHDKDQDQDSDFDSSLAAPEGATYKSHSGTEIDLLEDLKEKAEGELSDARKTESSAKYNFGMLKQSLEDQIAGDNKELSDTKTMKADAEQSKATAEGDLAETVEEIKATQANLDTVQSDCMTSATDHEASKKARAEELAVIAEAKSIVQEAVGGATSKVYSFLAVYSATYSATDSATQTGTRSMVRSSADLTNLELVAMVKKLAKENHSSALAQLASRINAVTRYGGANGEDIFGKVKGLITSMIAKLEKEAAEEASQKAYCDEEIAKTAAKKTELNSDIESLSAKIDKAASSSAKAKEEVATLQSELAALAKTMVEMDKARADESAAFAQAKQDLEAGITGVQKALEVLRDYYGSASLIQDNKKFDAFMQQPKPPAAHSPSSDAGGAIINVLEQCESDFSKDLAAEEMAEADALSSYNKVSQANKILKAKKEQDVKYKTKEAKSLDKSIADHSSDRSGLQTELSAVLDYQDKINSMCVAKPESYEERKARRSAEIAGLKEALKVLEGEGVFLQKRRLRMGAH